MYMCRPYISTMFYFTRDIKYTGINNIRRLVVHHPDVLIQNLHSVNVAIVQEVSVLASFSRIIYTQAAHISLLDS